MKQKIKVPLTLWNFLSRLELRPAKMAWCNPFQYLAATDVTADEERQMRSTTEYCISQNMEPIRGYVFENKKGTYFVPEKGGMIMKIDCKLPPLTIKGTKGSYTLEFRCVDPKGKK